jgi:hypothetical protein
LVERKLGICCSSARRKNYLVRPQSCIASKFNKCFATIGCKIASRLRAVAKNAWTKYEPENQSEQNPLELQPVNYETVGKVLSLLKVNKTAGMDKISARMIRDA